MPDHAELVCELLDACGIERADVLGYSWGGAVAQELARRAPDRVGRLVLCATSPGLGARPPRPVAAALLMTPARYYHPWLLAQTVPHIAGGVTKRERHAVRMRRPIRLESRPSVVGYAHQLLDLGLVVAALAAPHQRPHARRRRRRRSRRAHRERALAGRADPRRASASRPGRRAPVPLDQPDDVVPHILDFLDGA